MSTLICTWIDAFSAALAPSLFALLLIWLRQHHINTTVIEAVGRAAGEAYKEMVQSGGAATDRVSLTAAVGSGRDYLLARIPDTLKAAGVTPDGAAQMVSAELGKLLAIDPTVGVGATLARDSNDVAGSSAGASAGAAGMAHSGVATASPTA